MSEALMDIWEAGGPRRARRLAAAVRHAVAEEVAKLADPCLTDVVITGVDVGVDLDLATVYFYRRGGPDALATAEAALSRSAGRLRSAVGSHLRTRRVPRLRFRVDEGMTRGIAIEDRLAELAKAEAATDQEEDTAG